MSGLEHALAVAVNAARTVGAFLQKRHLQLLEDPKKYALDIQTKTSEIDLVTEVDGQAQEMYIDMLSQEFPEYRFIGEEKGAESLGSDDCPYAWIIDPLDGTTNFTRMKPNFGTILALQRGDELAIGIMYLPMSNQLYVAGDGLGALCNGHELHLRKTQNMRDAVICSNLIRRAVQMEDGKHYIPTPYCASVENYGCAATEIGEVLLGRNDGVFFDGVGLWDIAAGCILMQEAGGKYRYEFKEQGNPRSGVKAVLCTEPIFEELCEFVF